MLFVSLAALPAAALAQSPPPPPVTATLPATVLNHVVGFLRDGGTYAEGAALAEQIVGLVQPQLAAPKPEAGK